MRVRRMTEDGDYRFGNQQADFWRDQPEGVAQVVITRLRLERGEWFVDTSKGMPWQTAVLGKRTKETVQPSIQAEILGAPGVSSIENFQVTSEPNSRVVSVACTINTAFGPAVVEGAI